ncbi:putative Autoinducer 2 import system permease protein lsrD [Nostocoides japonicum T1-X7]|uniref:Autoinducer 2 import system permease protein LsrD n=1 Tax=Nostocoides japonicum T1-X7 TaxID=1194083 RepID=A0A077M1F1_9MICO|nr:ABC transporter permease [Tetrasphaera japonica]CCH78034.1 putative Autoinducer 2 import system permease protein lsrD [Tetrasphaera japonica T1-X7]
MTAISLGQRRRLPAWGAILGALLVLELGYFSVTNRNFFGGGTGMLTQIELFIPTGILAMGLALVILTGNIDLSAGAIASLSSVVVGTQLESGTVIGAIVVALVVSTVIGLVNGLIVAHLGIDSLLVTLATQFIASSLAVSLAGDNPPQDFASLFLTLGRGTVAGVPVALLIFAVVAAVVALLVGRSRFGRRLVLIGHNAEAARYSGIRVARTTVGVFTVSGLIAGIAGIVLAAYFNAGRSDSGMALLLPAITCVVLGGVDIFGGKGRVGEVVVAVLLLGFLTQGLLNSGFSSLATTMVTGLLLIVALVVKIAFEVRSDPSVLASTADRLRRRFAPRRPAADHG